ncbi:MAG: hypothetical protein NDP13_02340 [Crenarchaeota archaeon]|nr:hypothetical protein [Thermoproteota archaeon]MCR8455639.1 hypothetical protein [Thermoproteota archaeon]MCR8501343.1 hypothetical protein [Thermoproteota archaeon]
MEIGHVFRAYDIRGIANKDLTPDLILKASNIFANLVSENNGRCVAISGDVRASTMSFIYASVSGVISAGLHTYLTYPLPIPTFCFLIWRSKQIAGGAYVTASHNPPEYNGIRFRRGDGTGFSSENLEVKERFFKGIVKYAEWHSIGRVRRIPNKRIIEQYIDFINSRIPGASKSLSVIIDGKNGAANLVITELFAKLGHRILGINTNIDGKFPSGMPDPLHGDTSHLSNLTAQTKKPGIAYDGDGDRAAFFDENGRLVPSEIIGLFLAENLLKANDVIVYNTMCSSIIRRKAEEMGFRTVECRVGDVFMSEALKKHQGKLGVEESYHFFLPVYGFYYDDAIMASSLVINLLAQTEKTLANIYDSYGPFHTIRMNIGVSENIKFLAIDKFKEWALNNYSEVSVVDGVKIYLDNGSFLARPSNTEPLIRIVADADNKNYAEEIITKFTKKLEDIIASLTT